MTGDITNYLKGWEEGSDEDLNQAIALVYAELKKAAVYYLKGENSAHTLQPTALVNEVYLRLHKTSELRFENRNQFLWFAGKMMRRILCDHARAKQTAKRGGRENAISLEALAEVPDKLLDPALLISLDAALAKLETFDQRQSRIVEQRFFIGADMSTIAEVLGVSVPTVKREWAIAKRWLARELGAGKQE